ncbi:unnamed protein product [Rotaria magnacalcarata]
MFLYNLPPEIIYLIFKYLHKHDIVYSFLELNNNFTLIVKYFIAKQFDLTKINSDIIFQYCLSTGLALIGTNLRYLSIDKLTIYCCSEKEDIRRYAAYLIHGQLISLTFMFNDEIVGEQISLRLLHKSANGKFHRIPIGSSLRLYLSSMNNLILLKRYSESDYLSNGLYMIESILTGEWLTDNKDDLFLIHCEDEEHWISSSILSTHRKESLRSCSTFTFEKTDDENQFYIRPCYLNAKRLQVSGKRIISSLCGNDTSLSYRFRFHRVS